MHIIHMQKQMAVSVGEGLLNGIELRWSWQEFPLAYFRHNYVDRLPRVVQAAKVTLM